MSTLFQEFQATALKNGNLIAIDYLGNKISYLHLFEQIERFAFWADSNIQDKKEIITVCLPNIPQSVIIFYGLDKLGISMNFVHPETPPKQLKKFMKKIGSETVFLLDIKYKEFERELRDVKVVLCGINSYLSIVKSTLFIAKNALNLIGDFSQTVKFSETVKNHGQTVTSGNDLRPSVFLHSGGTTDEPKIIMLNDLVINNLAHKGKIILNVEDCCGKTMLAVLPIFHGFGLCICIHTILINGGTCAMFPKFMRKEIVKAISKGKINFIAGVPTMYEALLKTEGFSSKGLANLEYAFVGGDSLSSKLKAEFDKVLIENGSTAKLCEGYGLTETITVCSVNNPNSYVANSIGSPLNGIKMEIINENGEFNSPYEIGEIVVSGDTLMSGYYNDIVATNNVFIFKDGIKWLRTGDLGYKDDSNNFFFKQRKKRVFKVDGISVFPSEIEEVALSSKNVERACAVAREDSFHGNVVEIYVQTKNEPNSEIRAELETLFKNNLLRYAIPKKIIFVDQFKLTAVGKIDYKTLTHFKT